jgi:hypothetical protein
VATVVDRVSTEARRVEFTAVAVSAIRTLLTVVAGVLYGVGWIAARVFAAAWLCLVWSATAVRLGWQEGRRSGRGG